MSERRRFPSGQQDQYMLRFPNGMRDRLKAEAEKSRRSLNAEIIARLEDSFFVPAWAEPIATDENESDKVYFFGEQLKAVHARMAQLMQDAEFIRGRILEEMAGQKAQGGKDGGLDEPLTVSEAEAKTIVEAAFRVMDKGQKAPSVQRKLIHRRTDGKIKG